MNEQIIIDHEGEITSQTRRPKIDRAKWPYLVAVLIYVALMLYSIIAGLLGPTPLDNVGEILKRDTNYITVLTDSELAKFDDTDFFVVAKTYDNTTYHLVSYQNLEVYTLNIEELLKTEETVLWSSNDEAVLIIFDSSQSIISFSLENENFYSIINFYDGQDMAFGNFIFYVIMTIPLVLLMFPSLKDDTHTFFKDPEYKGTNKFLDSILPVFLVRILSGFLATGLSLALRLTSVSENQLLIEKSFTGFGAVLMFISVVVLAPIVEELVFRKGIFTLFKNKKAALITSVTTFTLIHVTTELINLIANGITFIGIAHLIILIIPYLAMAIFLGYLYKKNDENVVLTIFIHAFVNFIGAIAIIL